MVLSLTESVRVAYTVVFNAWAVGTLCAGRQCLRVLTSTTVAKLLPNSY
jgi:hypothetical protein